MCHPISIVLAAFLLLSGMAYAQVIPGGQLVYTRVADSEPLPFCTTVFEAGSLRYDEKCVENGRTGEVPDSCWNSDVKWEGRAFKISQGQKVLLPDSPFAVTFFASGEAVNGMVQEGWVSKYVFELVDPSFLRTSIVNDKTVVLFGEDFNLGVKTVNNFVDCQGGHLIKVLPKLYPIEEKLKVEKVIEKGEKVTGVPYTPSSFGTFTAKVHSFIEVGGVRFVEGVPAVKSFYVAPKINGRGVVPKSNCVSSSDCPAGFACEPFQSSEGGVNLCSRQEQVVKNSRKAVILGVSALSLTGVVAYLIYQRRRGKRG